MASTSPPYRQSCEARSAAGLSNDREKGGAPEVRLLLYFAAPLVCTALALMFERMRIPYASGGLFIIAVAFLLAAIRMLMVAPADLRASERLHKSARRGNRPRQLQP